MWLLGFYAHIGRLIILFSLIEIDFNEEIFRPIVSKISFINNYKATNYSYIIQFGIDDTLSK